MEESIESEPAHPRLSGQVDTERLEYQSVPAGRHHAEVWGENGFVWFSLVKRENYLKLIKLRNKIHFGNQQEKKMKFTILLHVQKHTSVRVDVKHQRGNREAESKSPEITEIVRA